jgi:hypothetical protein
MEEFVYVVRMLPFPAKINRNITPERKNIVKSEIEFGRPCH